MKKMICYLLINLWVTSAYSTVKTPAPSHSSKDTSATLDGEEIIYANDIQTAIQKMMFIENDFRGKQCNVRITISKKGAIGNDMQPEGYKPLCEAAMKAIRDADIPPAPNGKIYERFESLTVKFKPE